MRCAASCRPRKVLLLDGGSAMDAVCLAVELLEDCPLFKPAGHGAVFTHDETYESMPMLR